MALHDIDHEVNAATAAQRADASSTATGVWTIQEAAAYLSLPVNGLYKMTGPKARLRVPHIRIAGRLRFRKSDLDRWLDVLTVSNLDVLAKARRTAK
jgi:excisionase family DNA binding protein